MADDRTKAQKLMAELLDELGLFTSDEPELDRTPERFTQLLGEMTSTIGEDAPTMSTFPSSTSNEPVLLCALPFHSLCVHHLVPFFGTIDVAYIPNHMMVGFGSITRVIEHYARRPQVQERLVSQIADEIQHQLAPHGVLVRCRARQMCMELRGAHKRGILISSASHGRLGESMQRTNESHSRQRILAQFQAAEQPI